jgi:hypothetical protein
MSTELAEKFVAAGIGKANQIYPDGIGRFYQIDPDEDWQNSVNASKFVSTLLESIDIDCFLEHLDDDWRDRFSEIEGGYAHYDRERAFAFYTEDMTPAQFKTALDESGAREGAG